jgi:DNA-directed RNA polymerase subunit RPC12/RpoP
MSETGEREKMKYYCSRCQTDVESWTTRPERPKCPFCGDIVFPKMPIIEPGRPPETVEEGVRRMSRNIKLPPPSEDIGIPSFQGLVPRLKDWTLEISTDEKRNLLRVSITGEKNDPRLLELVEALREVDE